MVYARSLGRFCVDFIILIFFVGDYKLASQNGLSIGDVRHAPDIKVEEPSRASQGALHYQTGTCVVMSFTCFISSHKLILPTFALHICRLPLGFNLKLV